MKPPVELHRPTILNIIAIVCYCLAMLFHIIAFATDSWSTLHLEGVTWRVGLWQGCRQNANDTTWVCSDEVFEDKVFKTGSDWHLGARIMMIIALIALFLLEFFVIGYACIKRLDRYKGSLVGIIIGLSLTAGSLTLATLIYCGAAVLAGPGNTLEWPYGLVLLSFVFQVFCVALILFQRHRTNLQGKTMRKSRECISRVQDEDDAKFGYTNTVADVSSIEDFTF